MARRGKQSLNRKLTLIVVASVMAAVCVIAVASVTQEARRHTEGKVEYLQATAAVFASATSHAVGANDARAALLSLRGIGRAPSILYARVETNDGVRLAEIGSGVSLDSDANFVGGGAVSFIDALRSRTIQVSEPIVQGGEEVGRIVLMGDNSDLLPRIFATLLQTLLGALVALFVAVIIAARMQNWFVRPLLRLTDIVRGISQSHDYAARVDIDSDDEVGDLCSGFNVMLGEIKDRERKIIDLATHDAETDLPNRLAFERELAARIAGPRAANLVVAAIGVDRFQYVRGAIGYHLANDLLSEVGSRALMFGTMAARISTDVVAVIVNAPSPEEARALAGDVLAEIETPMMLGPNLLDINATVGLARFGVHAEAPHALIERACIALDQAYAAKAKIAMFDKAAYDETADNLSLMTDMMRALDNGEMSIHLQPKYDIRKGAITAAEVLARWRHPTRGMVRPDLFVGMAEQTGSIAPLTRWVLRAAIESQARLDAAGLKLSLAVNLSGGLVGDAEFIADALQLLEGAAGKIYLEITETATMDNQDLALRHIEALVAAGASISIDDYGQGLSSLAYLKRIPAQELKIDKAFVQSLGEQSRDALLVKSTIDLAHSLGMQVTAEGVEDEPTFAALATMGCDHIQGYLIGKPMTEANFVKLMSDVADAPARAVSAG
jgi:predicted signal transduction protein with EAL and GGDEF domain